LETFRLALVRRIVRESGESPELLGHLVRSLRNVARTQQAFGDLDAAHVRRRAAREVERRIARNATREPSRLRSGSIGER
jgi:hypothetical protein